MSYGRGVPVCDPHRSLLKAFPGTYLDPPERILLRRQIAEPALHELLADIDGCARCIRRGVLGTLHRVLFRISDTVTQADALFARLRPGFWQPDYLFDLKKKVLVLGDSEAAQASFLEPYVQGRYDRYLDTLGVSIGVRRDRFDLPAERAHWCLVAVLWNMHGDRSFIRWRLESYAYGASGIIAVCDVSVPSTVENLDSWIDAAHHLVGSVPTLVLAAKSEVGTTSPSTVERARALAEDCGASFVGPTRRRKMAADRAFKMLGTELLEKTFGVRPLGRPAEG